MEPEILGAIALGVLTVLGGIVKILLSWMDSTHKSYRVQIDALTDERRQLKDERINDYKEWVRVSDLREERDERNFQALTAVISETSRFRAVLERLADKLQNGEGGG